MQSCQMKAIIHTLFIDTTLFIDLMKFLARHNPTASKYQKNVPEWLIALTFSSETEMQGKVLFCQKYWKYAPLLISPEVQSKERFHQCRS